jgi:hypothetical protein
VLQHQQSLLALIVMMPWLPLLLLAMVCDSGHLSLQLEGRCYCAVPAAALWLCCHHADAALTPAAAQT